LSNLFNIALLSFFYTLQDLIEQATLWSDGTLADMPSCLGGGDKG